MTVKELIELLGKENPDSEVILQKDSEGNGYSPLCDVDEAIYVPDTTWSGWVYSLEWTADECLLETKEWNILKKGPHCIVLSPIN